MGLCCMLYVLDHFECLWTVLGINFETYTPQKSSDGVTWGTLIAENISQWEDRMADELDLTYVEVKLI